MSPQASHFADLPALAKHLRGVLRQKKYVLLFAYNGTGKTRLSMAFKNEGKRSDKRDTLYFNAFTEDLFSWNNDLEGDSDRELRMNTASRFFDGLQEFASSPRAAWGRVRGAPRHVRSCTGSAAVPTQRVGTRVDKQHGP